MVSAEKKIVLFAIFVFVVLVLQEINLRGNLQGAKCDGDYNFYENVLRFTKKLLLLLTL